MAIISKIKLPDNNEPYVLKDSETSKNLNIHKENSNIHITEEERVKWNSMDIPITSNPDDATDMWIDPNIDNANGENFAVIKTGQITLTTAGWAGEGPFTQVVNHTNIGARTQVNVDASIALLDQMEADGVVAIFIENNNGIATAYIKGAKFTTDVTIDVSFMEVGI